MTNHTLAGRLALGFALSCMPLLGLGCSAADDSTAESESAGQLTFALTSTTPTGQVYRLRDATFELATPNGVPQGALSSEADPSSSTLTANLPVGSYTSALANGWRIEKQVAGDYVQVTAVLLSANVQPFTIAAGSSTAVVYNFKVPGDVVTLGGSVVVSANITEETSSPIPAGWTCDPNYYHTNDGCDCGCGVVDPDCIGGAGAICDFDNCPEPKHAQPGNNTQCI